MQTSFSSLSSVDLLTTSSSFHHHNNQDQQHQNPPFYQQHQQQLHFQSLHHQQQANFESNDHNRTLNQTLQQYSIDSIDSIDLFPEIIFSQSDQVFSNHPSSTSSEVSSQINITSSPHSAQPTSEAASGNHLSQLSQNLDASIESRLQSHYKEEHLLDSDLDIDSFKPLHPSPSPPQQFFGRTPEVNPLSIRSSSDPTIALNSIQGQQQDNREQTDITNESAVAAALAEGLPSFKEIYPIKYNQQLSEIGLKMDEDCFNMVTSNLPNPAANFHPGQQMSQTFNQEQDSFNEMNMHPSSHQQHLSHQQQSQLQSHFISCQFISPIHASSNSGYQYQQAPAQQVHPTHMVSIVVSYSG